MKLLKKHIKLISFVILLFFLGGIGLYLKDKGVEINADTFIKWRDKNIVLATIFYLIFTVFGSVVLVVPAVTFAIVAGLIFHPVIGVLMCSFAATIGAGIAFIMGRFFLSESIRPLVLKNKFLKKILLDDSDKNALTILMITRLVPLFPFNLQNYAYGITDISFAKYMIFTFLFIIPGTAMYTIGAGGITDEENRLLYFVLAGVMAVLVSLIGYIVKKKYIED